LLVACVNPALFADAPPLTLSHCWIVVSTGAPERTALEKAGFRIAPTVNRHDGQGTASITVELLNGFLELDVTLDNGAQGVTKILEPDLPMVVHY
jgi:hypothetical protein